VNRAKEAVETGASVIGTACPFCNAMLDDGLKNLDKDEEVQARDIAQCSPRPVARRSKSTKAAVKAEEEAQRKAEEKKKKAGGSQKEEGRRRG
jgi:Fe-S oxidoreductase